jgi:type IV pilus assembly protein PilZ
MAPKRGHSPLSRPAPQVNVQDKRSPPRIPLNADVTCEASGAPNIGGRAKDISIGGMFIESEAQVTFGVEVSIVLRLPNTKQDLRVPAVIRWIKPGGFGVQFGLLGARETHALSELFKS